VREGRAYGDAARRCFGLLRQLQLRRLSRRRIFWVLVLLPTRRLRCAGVITVVVKERVVYVLSKSRGRHIADASKRHSVPPGVVREVTMVDDAIVPDAVRW
jgi:uncharacterized protein YjeT (DUF2065 family)